MAFTFYMSYKDLCTLFPTDLKVPENKNISYNFVLPQHLQKSLHIHAINVHWAEYDQQLEVAAASQLQFDNNQTLNFSYLY